MKKSILFLMVMIFTTISGISQNALYNVSGTFTKNTLIREFQPGIDIVFNDYNGLQSFIYLDRMGSIAYEAVSSYQIEVTDMEIYDDILYFCGRMPSMTNTNFVGFFDVGGLFFGSQPVTILPIYYNPVDTVDNVPIQGELVLSKLEVYKVPSIVANETHIYLIGDVSFNSSQTTDYSCLFDMMQVSTMWSYDMAYEPDRVYYFNDLTVTDKFLVVVGNKHGGTGEYIHGYGLPYSAPYFLQHTFNNSLSTGSGLTIQYWFTNAMEYYPISKPLIETLTGDAFATACYGMWQDNPGVIVSWYSTYGSLVKRFFVPNVTGSSEFRDLKYNDITDNIYLMPDHTRSTTIDQLYGLGLTAASCIIYQSPMETLHSLDRIVNNPDVVLSGEWGADLAIMKLESTTHDCVTSNVLPVTTSNYPPECATFVHDVSNTKVIPMAVYPGINILPLERSCGEESLKQQPLKQQ